MSKFKISSLIIGLVSLTLVAVVSFAQTGRSQLIQLTTNPPIGQFYPFEAEAQSPQSPVKLTLAARNPDGQLLENSKFKLQIFTPSANPFLSTDFPVVEGTKLLEMEATAPQGKLEIEQMLPIRGKYQLLVDVAPIAGDSFTPIHQTLTLDVPEAPVKYRNYGILLIVLLAVGIGGGWVIGKQQSPQPGEIAPARVRLLLSGAIIVAIASLLVVNISAEMVESHSHAHQATAEKPAVINDSQIKLQITGDKYATVGEVANFQVQAIDTKTNLPVKDVVFKIATTQLEHNWTAFAYQGIADDNGQFTWQQQFFDGATHNLSVEVAPSQNSERQFQPVVAVQEIEVAGVATPLFTRLISLAYLVGAIATGLAIALWLRRRGTPKREFRQV
ncbi:hypothetical protein [Aliterella atlantica]|uniref:Uncharacterized protein n=1 Tax=Aliterella atlantica CENA595 TaxID=1618023 RepID=A0A0D9A0I4_9CYAN|nr:hypothetical protein [Aliterella atlantica]KJH72981.1 hypothetical protein UH38_02580 [Aliterella atlantica CENA595]